MNNINDNLPGQGTRQPLVIATAIFIVGSLLYTGFVVIYRLYFHPLAKFPGAFLNSVSDVREKKVPPVILC